MGFYEFSILFKFKKNLGLECEKKRKPINWVLVFLCLRLVYLYSIIEYEDAFWIERSMARLPVYSLCSEEDKIVDKNIKLPFTIHYDGTVVGAL